MKTRRSLFALWVGLFLSSSAPSFALITLELDLAVEPKRVTAGQIVEVTVTGVASCPSLVGTNFGDGFLEVHYSGYCPILPPDPGPFELDTTVQFLFPGFWEVRVIDVDAPENPGALMATAEVSVVDPSFSIEFEPSPATPSDTVSVVVEGLASCFWDERSTFEVSPGRIIFRLLDLYVGCGPPLPLKPFTFERTLGQLDPGVYVAEVFLEDLRVSDASLVVGEGLTENLRFDVEPTNALTTEPLVVAVRGEASCPELVEQTVGDGVVEIFYRAFCPILPPAPEPFLLFTLIDPLPPGIWEFRLVDLDIPVSPPAVVQAIDVTVTDPNFAVELMPSPATIDDEVVATLTGVGDCVTMSPVEIGPGSLVFRVEESGICNPPTNEPFGFIVEVGQLAAGQYLAEFFFNGQRVAESTLEVQAQPRTCVSDSNGLCLNQERFRVEAVWTTRDGNSGTATPVPETDDTGLFWFFDEDNVELVVKVLDGCNTAIPNFWVFAAGLTDVGVRLTVSDTQTGRFVVYETTPGQTFEPITDTAAFDICPGS